ncbi:NAD(P)-dependent alcohol dehydrogenase [Opitutaceae bacterium TAV4]|nr:NAD(P)-dependent alcohol dehydrogenase [Opitutaceae bacterium TAV4]RRK00696.1 NAD(P)-dependent alcohol dehydrogenase [Opitutaceae bacterium TAV3]
MPIARAYSATRPDAALAPFSLRRREPLPHDVEIAILYCGVCHSDLHQARNEWRDTVYPCVPGHEITGRVARIGEKVTKFQPGDSVAVGCMVDSCRTCPSCREGLENYCENGSTGTYNDPDRHSGGVTQGGYSESIVVDEAFVLRVPPGLDLAAAAPLLCAGITTWSPLRHWKIGPGHRVGVVGLGGLGHMAIKLARALGAEVTLFTTSPGKAEDARRLGAHDAVVSKNPDALSAHRNRLDFILDTVSAPHDVNVWLNLLRRDGTLALVGAPLEPHPLAAFSLLTHRRQVAGSMIGSIRETQELLDFCAARGIAADIERIPIQRINEAFVRLLAGEVKYRFVIDMKSLASAPS